MTLSSRQRNQIRRAEMYGDQNGLCFHCEEPMKLLGKYPPTGVLPKNTCVAERHHDGTWAAACFGCNQVGRVG